MLEPGYPLARLPSLPFLPDNPGGCPHRDWCTPLRIARSLLPIAFAAVLTAGLVACSTPTPEPTPESEAPEVVEEETAPETSGDFTAASFAKPVTNPGELLDTFSGENFQVDVYQVDTAIAEKTGQFVNPDTNKPIIEIGAEIVFVNYVITNTGSEDIPLTYSLVDVTARYDDWPYMQGMDSVVSSELFGSMQVNDTGLGLDVGESPFIWEPGTSFSYGQNFLYQSGSPIVFTASLTPADEDGDLVHDEKQEIELATTIK